MKKSHILLLAAAFLCSFMPQDTGKAVGKIEQSNIQSYINQYPIDSYQYNGRALIETRKLSQYGFDVQEKKQTVSITRNKEKAIAPETKEKATLSGEAALVYQNKRKVTLDGEDVPAFLVNGETMIYIKDVDQYGTVEWDENARTVDVTLDAVAFEGTPILGDAQVSLEQAKAWARGKGADQRFIDIADLYWKIGEQSEIRPEVLYAQAAKETNYGKYTGNVVPEQNNWAGIKTATASGDTTEDHETFATPEDGVRAHFNHMSAYVSVPVMGTPHGRYDVVKSTPWAGTVQYVEQLGGRWAPDESYGNSIVQQYLNGMMETKT